MSGRPRKDNILTIIIALNDTTAGEDTQCGTEEIVATSQGGDQLQRMTMDGMEVVGSQPHAATSPFLLSPPPLGHHHHHHHPHATFNLQTVQLSFDACLPYNSATSSNSIVCGVGGTSTPAATTCTSSTSCNKTIPSLSLAPCAPLQAQHQNSADTTDHHGRHHQHHHQRLNDHQHHRHVDASSPSSDSTDGKRRLQSVNEEKDCSRECRDDLQESNDKDKTGDLNTPVTTSSDLPSFFGPSALVEPPPISGTYNQQSFKTKKKKKKKKEKKFTIRPSSIQATITRFSSSLTSRRRTVVEYLVKYSLLPLYRIEIIPCVHTSTRSNRES